MIEVQEFVLRSSTPFGRFQYAHGGDLIGYPLHACLNYAPDVPGLWVVYSD